MIYREKAYARGALIGNPSDGYFGKTIALAFSNFSASVTLYESPDLEIVPNTRDHSRFRSIGGLAEDVQLFGYYGGIRLLKATVKRFHDYCHEANIDLHGRNFTIRYNSDIPHMVGLAGSSAIITACLRTLMAFFGVSISRPQQANLVLSVEQDELRISAGLQDRVAQVYQGLVYMDFSEDIMKSQDYGRYEELDPEILPPLYIAYRLDLSQGSDIVHNDFRERFARKDKAVLKSIAKWVDLTDAARECLKNGNAQELGKLMDSNFDCRARVMPLSEGNLKMVEAARSVGCSAKFTGSGGAIIGTYANEKMYAALKRALEPMNIRVIKPIPAQSTGEKPS